MSVHSLALLLTVLGLVASASVHAAPPGSPVLNWSAPAGCPDAQDVRRSLERWLGRSADQVDGRSLTVTADVRREQERFVLTLVLESPSGRAHEELRATSCATLVEVLGLQVALAADSAGALAELARRTEPGREAPIGPSADPNAGARIALRVFGGGAVGQLPNPSGSLGLAGVLGLGWLGLELWSVYSPPRATYYAELPKVGAELSLLSFEARACALPDLFTVELPICGGVELGIMRGTGLGTPERFDSDQLFGAVVFGPALRWRFGRTLALWLGVDLLLGFARPSYHMRNLPALYRPEIASARAAAGVEVAF